MPWRPAWQPGKRSSRQRKKQISPARSLSRYQRALESCFVLKDLRTFRAAPAFLKNPRIYGPYAEAAVETLSAYWRTTAGHATRTFAVVKDVLRKKVGIMQLLADIWHMRKAL